MAAAPQEQPPLETGFKAPPDGYIMWPRDELSSEEIDSTDSAIRQIVGPEVAIEKTIGAKGHPKEFLMHWYGCLSQAQVVDIEKLDGVCQPLCQKMSSCIVAMTDISVQISQVQKNKIDPDVTFNVFKDGRPWSY